MQTEQLIFSGLMDLDDPNSNFPKGAVKEARNILWRGTENNYRAENTKGTRQITLSLPTGSNQCIGSYYDDRKQRVFWLNWNSNGRNGIYQFDTLTEVVTPLLVCYTHSADDILNFNPTRPIPSINILYGDAALGDILLFVDSIKRPTKLNIGRAASSGYGTIVRSFLDVAKEPPLLPPTVAYANDGAATVNNLRKGLFQFAYRLVFDDKEKSTQSGWSQLPLPAAFLDTNNDADPTKNSKITITLQTGKSNVKKIELIGRQNTGKVYGDPFLITSLNKAELAIANNAAYSYDFKNNSSYNSINLKESILLYDYAPREANTQELLNGNIIIYGGIKEGYNNDYTFNAASATDLVAGETSVTEITNAYNWNTRYKLGIIYRDEKGRTNGVVTAATLDFTTPEYTEASPTSVNIPRITLTINHVPPLWAYSYDIVRTANLSQQEYLYYITESSYKDTDYAYVSIQNIYNYLTKEPSQADVLKYDFSNGDRIKFIKRVSGATTVTTYTGTDYEIVGMVQSPVISSEKREGFFLKIKLPTTTGTFDFGATGFGNYLVEIYTPAKPVDKGLDTFFEFGESYLVGNPGLSTRYHNASFQTQTNLLPAIFRLTKGDAYFKSRKMSLGGAINYSVTPGGTIRGFHTIGSSVTSKDATNATYLTGNSPFESLAGFDYATNDTRWIIKTVGDAYSFNIKGSIKTIIDEPQNFYVYLQYSNGTVVDIIPDRNLSQGATTTYFIDKSFVVPSGVKVFIVARHNEGTSMTYLEGSFKLYNETASTLKIIDKSFADTFLSEVNSNGRAVVVDETLTENYDPVLARYSLAYQDGTNINQTNRFYSLNYETVDRNYGDIERFGIIGSELIFFQRSGAIPFGVYQQLLSNPDGNSQLMSTDKILSKKSYYVHKFGLGNQPNSLTKNANAFYGCDNIRGYHWRLAGDGFTPISEIYKAQFWLPPIAKRYLNNINYSTGGYAKILGVYDFFEEQYISVFQNGEDKPGYTLAFNEARNGYSSFFDYEPEWIMCAETTLISWLNGLMYIHDNETTNTFYGTSYPSKVKVIVNPNANVKKEFLALGYHSKSTDTWIAPTINDVTTTGGQRSNLVAGDFEFKEDMFHAAFMKDADSIGGVVNGNYLLGTWLQLNLELTSSSLSFLYGLYCNYRISQKNF